MMTKAHKMKTWTKTTKSYRTTTHINQEKKHTNDYKNK